MKRWWGWVFAWLGVVGLLLSLGLEITSVNHYPYAGSERSVGLCRKSISIASFSTLLATSMQWIQSRAGPLESFAIPCALSAAGDVGPPWLDYRGPPGVCGGRPGELPGCRPRRQLRAGAEHASSNEIPAVNGSNEKVEFCNSL
jgi:hypothetical protein